MMEGSTIDWFLDLNIGELLMNLTHRLKTPIFLILIIVYGVHFKI